MRRKKRPGIRRQQPKWVNGIWKEMTGFGAEQRETATSRFLSFLSAGKYRRHKGVRYAVSGAFGVLEIGGHFVKGVSRPIITVPEGLGIGSEREIVEHELLEWEKGRTIAHSRKAMQSKTRKETIAELAALVERRNMEITKTVERFSKTKRFRAIVQGYARKFERYKAMHLRLGKKPSGNIAQHLDAKKEQMEVVFGKSKLRGLFCFSPIAGQVSFGILGEGNTWSINLVTGKEQFYPVNAISKKMISKG